MGRLLLRSSMRLIGLVDQLSVHIWQNGDHWQGRESEGRQSWTNQQICLPGVSVSVVHGVEVYFYALVHTIEGAINCILARTSHQRTTSEKRTKALLPKCPLFGGSTVLILTILLICRMNYKQHVVALIYCWLYCSVTPFTGTSHHQDQEIWSHSPSR